MVAEHDPGQEDTELGPLAVKVEWLIANKWPAGRQPPKTNGDVVKAIAEVTGVELNKTTIWKLRIGKIANPTLKTMQLLREFFRLPSIGYFDDGETAEQIAGDVALQALLSENGIGSAVLRTLAELSPDGRATVTDMIDSIARRERERAESGTAGQKSK